MLESSFNRLQHRCFSKKFAKILKVPVLNKKHAVAASVSVRIFVLIR